MQQLAEFPLLWVGLSHAGPTPFGPNYDIKPGVKTTCATYHGLR